ncbi:hypothetical protein BWK60_07655 [Flavobacterium covae]|uniref:helix-turn-helix domain-containing protein n=1 Tax=Flavobacterium covae TaxID=2906076 RepID=UPI000B4DE3A8|nr:helix-turn-helix transcriptional regulator [Flavobacterium covae]OWP86647.1 hypothetical protein BWK60_07655 [Flavobacterium covae]
MDTIAERLNFYRKNKGLTYKDISDKLGLSEGAIRIAIKRKNVKLSHINEIAEKFGVSKDWLINGSGDMEKKEKVYEKNEFYTNQELIKLKDDIISDQKDLIKSLKNQIELLNEKILIILTEINMKSEKTFLLTEKHFEYFKLHKEFDDLDNVLKKSIKKNNDLL